MTSLEALRKISQNPEAKNLIGNFTSLALLQVAGYIFPLLTVPYLANVIGVEYYGRIAFAFAIMVYFQTIVDYGFVFSAVRDIARTRQNLDMVSEIYSNVMWARMVLLLISFILLTICIVLVPKLYELRYVLYASFLMVIGHAFFPDWLFQGLEKMKYITIFNVLIKLIFTGAVFIFIKKPQDYILQPILISLGYIVSGIISMLLIKKWGIKFSKPNLKNILISLKTNIDLFINQIVPNLYNSASIMILGFAYGSTANGIYDVANRFTTAGGSLFTIVSRTFYPFLSRRIDKHSLFIRINLILSICAAAVLFFASPWLIKYFFPKSFVDSINVLRILSISLIFLAMSNVYGTNFLILKGYEKSLRTITIIASVIGFILAVPLIYIYSYIGVAIAVTTARGMIAILSYYKCKQIKKL